MTGPVPPLRRASDLKRLRRRAGEAVAAEPSAEDRNLPVPIEAEPAAPPPPPPRPAPGATYAAHLLGQKDAKRGLRGGQEVLDAARSAYLGAEYSGPADRRPRQGVVKKREV